MTLWPSAVYLLEAGGRGRAPCCCGQNSVVAIVRTAFLYVPRRVRAIISDVVKCYSVYVHDTMLEKRFPGGYLFGNASLTQKHNPLV